MSPTLSLSRASTADSSVLSRGCVPSASGSQAFESDADDDSLPTQKRPRITSNALSLNPSTGNSETRLARLDSDLDYTPLGSGSDSDCTGSDFGDEEIIPDDLQFQDDDDEEIGSITIPEDTYAQQISGTENDLDGNLPGALARLLESIEPIQAAERQLLDSLEGEDFDEPISQQVVANESVTLDPDTAARTIISLVESKWRNKVADFVRTLPSKLDPVIKKGSATIFDVHTARTWAPSDDTQLNELFKDFVAQETALSKKPKSTLVKPSGTLQSPLAVLLNYPTYTTQQVHYGNTYDLSNCCIRLTDSQLKGTSALYLDCFSRRFDRKTIESLTPADFSTPYSVHYSKAVVDAHTAFAKTILDKSKAKILLLRGRVALERYREWHPHSTFVPLEGGCLLYGTPFGLFVESFGEAIHRLVVYAPHPEWFLRKAGSCVSTQLSGHTPLFEGIFNLVVGAVSGSPLLPIVLSPVVDQTPLVKASSVKMRTPAIYRKLVALVDTSNEAPLSRTEMLMSLEAAFARMESAGQPIGFDTKVRLRAECRRLAPRDGPELPANLLCKETMHIKFRLGIVPSRVALAISAARRDAALDPDVVSQRVHTRESLRRLNRNRNVRLEAMGALLTVTGHQGRAAALIGIPLSEYLSLSRGDKFQLSRAQTNAEKEAAMSPEELSQKRYRRQKTVRRLRPVEEKAAELNISVDEFQSLPPSFVAQRTRDRRQAKIDEDLTPDELAAKQKARALCKRARRSEAEKAAEHNMSVEEYSALPRGARTKLTNKLRQDEKDAKMTPEQLAIQLHKREVNTRAKRPIEEKAADLGITAEEYAALSKSALMKLAKTRR